jgi:microcystin degradation protein MlrC
VIELAYTDPETAELWDRFHALVNMPSPDLRAWLGTAPTDPAAYRFDPDLDVVETGRRVLQLLERRRTDLTAADTALMRQVTDVIAAWLADPHEDDDRWRHSLMSLGHDPLKADSPRGDEATAVPPGGAG